MKICVQHDDLKTRATRRATSRRRCARPPTGQAAEEPLRTDDGTLAGSRQILEGSGNDSRLQRRYLLHETERHHDSRDELGSSKPGSTTGTPQGESGEVRAAIYGGTQAGFATASRGQPCAL